VIRFALTDGMSAVTIDVRHLFHGLARDAAVFARRCHTRTDWVRAFLGIVGGHFYSPGRKFITGIFTLES
jgi:hypothetical protein